MVQFEPSFTIQDKFLSHIFFLFDIRPHLIEKTSVVIFKGYQLVPSNYDFAMSLTTQANFRGMKRFL